MAWGSSIQSHPNLVLVHTKMPAAYYTNAEVAYQESGTQVSSVIYGFYRDQLFAAFVKLKTPLQFSNLKRHFSTRYGAPKTKHYPDSGLTVYRWKDKAVKIKLKIRDAAKEMKMAIYYDPLATEFNQEQLENMPREVWNLPSAPKREARKKKPLIVF